MALGDPYVTLKKLKGYEGVPDEVDDEVLTDALASVSREIEGHTGRQFNTDDTASPRLYVVEDRRVVLVDDFHTTDGLVVETDADGDGVFETTWTAADYQLEPLNGIVDGRPGWPYSTIRAVGVRVFPQSRHERATLRVTARWGWAEVPDPVRQACLILAAETAKLKDAPFGVAGYGDYGPVRVRDNPKAMAKLARYVLDPVVIA